MNIQSSFAYFDQDRSRTLQTHEVQQALQHAGERSLEPLGGGAGVLCRATCTTAL